MAKDIKIQVHNDKICGVVMNYEDAPVLFRRDAYFLTASGRELFHIMHNSENYEADEDYTLLCLEDMKKGNPAFYVGAFKILNGGSSVDLLEDI